MIATAVEDLQNLPFSVAIAESAWMFPTIESLHVLALAVVVGSIMIMDLRLLGIARRRLPVTQVAEEILPWTWMAFVSAAITGGLMFVSRAADYWENDFFRVKIVLLGLAGLNMGVFHLMTWRAVEAWREGATPMAARAAALTSLMLWIAIVICGRWIGFA